MDLYEAIYNRRIIRDFKDKQIPENVLEKIIDAGLQAPTHDHLRKYISCSNSRRSCMFNENTCR